MKVRLIQQTPDPMAIITRIAGTCYDSRPKDAEKLVRHLYRNGHHSVFEHIYFTFEIEGISRACSHELVRHRLCAFTQRSQRYCDEDGFDFVTPEAVPEELVQEYESFMRDCTAFYQRLKEAGLKNEDARFVLPNACTTKMVVSMNLRELVHICNERLCLRAQWEIRELVGQMAELVDASLRFMLVPKCQSGRIVCENNCLGGK